MRSKWYEYKRHVVRLRKRGWSYRRLEQRFGVPRSTLSGWLCALTLDKNLRKKMREEWRKNIVRSRENAIRWHHEQKRVRLEAARNRAEKILATMSIENESTLRIALALLYFGEGSKRNVETALGSSDPLIIRFFMKSIEILYGLDMTRMRYELALRADQNPITMKRYWSKELGVPMRCFKGANVDKRTLGKETYLEYKGVCQIRCGNVAIQRELIFLSRMYCEAIVNGTLSIKVSNNKGA